MIFHFNLHNEPSANPISYHEQYYLLKTLGSTIVRIWDFSFIMLHTIWAHQLNLHHPNHARKNTYKTKGPQRREQNVILTFLCASSGKVCLNFHLLKASNMSSKAKKKGPLLLRIANQRHIRKDELKHPWTNMPTPSKVQIKISQKHITEHFHYVRAYLCFACP